MNDLTLMMYVVEMGMEMVDFGVVLQRFLRMRADLLMLWVMEVEELWVLFFRWCQDLWKFELGMLFSL